ncbi:ATP-dependent nuclease [Roseovarius sp. MS2]|uniref:ATP-dependent nuclease n=1 Tax=Roseovarius sp. MS2 TaxID=3390728 RepID=UPI003EDC9780
MTEETIRFTEVEFHRFKAFRHYRIQLKQFNILVGPNNAGKSTILTAFRILASSIRRGNAKKATIVSSPEGQAYGYHVDLKNISVADENIFHNYDDTVDAYVRFYLSNGNSLMLFFPKDGGCSLIPYSSGKAALTPTSFRKAFNCPIGFVPILGPVEHREELFGPEAARLALFNYRAARNFRNIWHHYPEDFDEFRESLIRSWPGMDIQRPEISHEPPKSYLHMFCPEDRIPREIFWAGFGFQVWCQMLTHLIKNKNASIFLIDEPDIYLHSSLQRQLLGILRELGPDILLATHSTEIITEAETDEIVVVNKANKSSRRLRNPAQLGGVFQTLGSNTNPVLTQLARTRRALFVEGKDFRILGRFARKLGRADVANSKDFAVVAAQGFNPERIRNMIDGMEATLGFKIVSAAVLDRDFRSIDECEAIRNDCLKHCKFVSIHKRKEIENFLLIPDAIARSATKRMEKSHNGTARSNVTGSDIKKILEEYSNEKKSYLAAQLTESYKAFFRNTHSGRHATELAAIAFNEFDKSWSDPETRIAMLPGKDALSKINLHLQDKFGVSVSPSAIIDAMYVTEVPDEMTKLVSLLSDFSSVLTPA